MGKGAYMFVYNLDSNSQSTSVYGIDCMHDGGDEGSNVSLWNNQVVPSQAAIPTNGWQSPQYIEANGSGSCAFTQSSFNMGFQSGASLKVELQSSSIPANVTTQGNIVCSLNANNPIWPYDSQVGIGVLILPDSSEVPQQNGFTTNNASNWMSELNSVSNGAFFNQPVYMVSFPAAHDAGMSSASCTSVGSSAVTQTQTLDISGQLNAGVRYFDLRPYVWDIGKNNGPNDFAFGHFSYISALKSVQGCMGQNMVSALQQVQSFITNHPGEIVILKFSEFHDTHLDQNNNLNKFPVALQQLMIQTIKQNLGNVMFTAANGEKVTTKTLQTIINSGKRVICLFDSLDPSLQDPANGVLVYGDLTGSTSNSNFDVFDQYSGTSNLAIMVADQIDKYRQFLSKTGSIFPTGGMFLFSYTLTLTSTQDNILSSLGFGSILSLADYAHCYLWPVITSLKQLPITKQPPNFIYMDKVDSSNAVTVARFFNMQVLNITPASVAVNDLTTESTSANPAIATFQNKLYVAFKSNDPSNKLLYVTSPDGVNWTNGLQINSDSTSDGPALTVFQNKLYAVFKSNDSSNSLICLSTANGTDWSQDSVISGESTSANPAIAAFQNQLYVLFKSNDPSNRLLYVTSTDGINWTACKQINSDSTSDGPALTVYQNKLYVVFKSNDPANSMICCSTANGTDWPQRSVISGESTSASPAIAAFQNQLYVLFKSNDPSNRLLYVTSTDGTNWTNCQQIENDSTSDGPAVTVFQNTLFTVFKANDPSNSIHSAALGLYALKCLGSDHNPNYLYLDGHTGDGTIGLAPNTTGIYTGTHWQLEPLSDGSVALKCLGANNNPNYIYLDGRTGNGTTGLVPNTTGIYTGTHWQLEPLNDGSVALKCLGANNNPNYIYLDGHTGDGTVGLAPNTTGIYTGTHWKLEPISATGALALAGV